MSFDLAFWVGPRPSSDEAAADEFERRAAFMDDEAQLRPPTPPIAAFIADLLATYPPLGEDGDEDCPWATGPEPGDLNGDFAYLTMTYSGAEAAYDFVTETARKHGLVCFDPQSEALV